LSGKFSLRFKAKALRANMDKSVRELAVKSLNDNLSAYYRVTSLPESLGFYWPVGSEMDIMPFIHELAIQNEVKLCLPVINGDEEPMDFVVWTPESEMKQGGNSIPEPVRRDASVMPDVLLVPLLMCDKRGNRLGYGKGHYDRTINAMARKPFLIGVGFDEQLYADNLPAESHDIKLNLIITPRQVIEIK